MIPRATDGPTPDTSREELVERLRTLGELFAFGRSAVACKAAADLIAEDGRELARLREERDKVEAARVAACDDYNAMRWKCDEWATRATRLAAAVRRGIGAIEALAVRDHGGPEVSWDAIDATQDEMRSAVREIETAAAAVTEVRG